MIRLVALALTLLLAPTMGLAAPITHPSQLSPNQTLIDFENFNGGTLLPNPLTIGNATFTSLTGMLSILDITASGWAVDGTEVASKTLFPGGEPDSAIAITFATPVAEFLLGWGDPSFPGNVLLAYDVHGNLLEQAAVALGPPGVIHAAWIGFRRSTADIARIVVQPDQSLSNGDDYVIDNVRYRVAPGSFGFTKIADTADGRFSGFGGQPSINAAGVVAFQGECKPPAPCGPRYEGVFKGTGGALVTVADSAGPLTGFSGITTVNSAGMVAFRATLDAGGDGIFIGDGRAIDTVVTSGGFFAGFDSAWINATGSVVFFASLTSGGEGVFLAPPSASITTIGDSSGLFSSFGLHPSINDAGTVAFSAGLDDGGSGIFTSTGSLLTPISATTDSSLFRTDVFVTADSGVVLASLVGDDLLATIAADARFAGASLGVGPFRSINDLGQVAFFARFPGGREAIFRADPLSILAATADTYLRSGAPNTNEGASEFLRVREAGDNRALVRFDQAAIAAVIGDRTLLAATLVMDVANNGNNWGMQGRSVDLHRMLMTWAEGNGREADYSQTQSFRGSIPGATWNCASDANTTNGRPDCFGVSAWEMAKPNRSDLHPWTAAPTASSLITNGLIGSVEWDVTADVQAFLGGTADNYGWIVKKANEGQPGRVDFASRESGLGPRLLIKLGP